MYVFIIIYSFPNIFIIHNTLIINKTAVEYDRNTHGGDNLYTITVGYLTCYRY